jgi:dihydroflavonol-4-reductase
VPDAFLTGGSGWVGGAVLRRLVAEGRHVLALARSDEAAATVSALGAEAVRGDLLEHGEWEAALAGCSTVFHIAGEVAMCDRGRLEVNVAGTRRVIAAARKAGVGRVVFTSSAATIGEAKGAVGTEATPHPGTYLSEYARTKHEAELAAFADAAAAGIEVVAVNPSSVQGPGRVTGSARIFIGYLQGRLRWAVRTRLPIVFVDDMVDAHLLAETRGRAGERYLVNGWSPTVAEVVALLGRAADVDHRVRYLPSWMLAAAATAVEALWEPFGKEPPLCRAMAREVAHGHVYDSSKAERDLGLRFTPPEEWLAATVAWYREQGMVG